MSVRSFRSEIFEALAVEFPDAIIRYERDRFRAGAGSTFTISQFIYELKKPLSVGFFVADAEAENCLDIEDLIKALVGNARFDWDKELASARSSA